MSSSGKTFLWLLAGAAAAYTLYSFYKDYKAEKVIKDSLMKGNKAFEEENIRKGQSDLFLSPGPFRKMTKEEEDLMKLYTPGILID